MCKNTTVHRDTVCYQKFPSYVTKLLHYYRNEILNSIYFPPRHYCKPQQYLYDLYDCDHGFSDLLTYTFMLSLLGQSLHVFMLVLESRGNLSKKGVKCCASGLTYLCVLACRVSSASGRSKATRWREQSLWQSWNEPKEGVVEAWVVYWRPTHSLWAPLRRDSGRRAHMNPFCLVTTWWIPST